MSSYRFITINSLNVRTKPSIRKSKVIGQLHLGNIVEIIDKRKNWIKILYLDKKNDISIKGWVFTRYTRKFEK